MNSYFQNKVVLITGASSGIGKALAMGMLQQGAKVAICGRNPTSLDIVAAEINNKSLICIQADVSQEADCAKFVQTAFSHFGSIDILINNAGISMRALFQEVELEVIRQSMDINFWGTVYCCKFALPHILKSKGHIVGISSIAGYKGLPCRTGYSASKFAMQGFLESLRIEMLYQGVNVMWVSPGFVASNIRNTALNAQGKAQTETPLNEDKLMSADTCARIIMKSIEQRKRSLLMDKQGWLTVWVNRFFPNYADRQVYKHFANEPDSPLNKIKTIS
ncbi:MAG: SDR family oxidoreductase [Bacteroidetes bacterium]|nr:SDR family oxidoreductase [Bacteroidota bacterium]